MLLDQNGIICSPSIEDLLPTKRVSFSLKKDEGKQENRATWRQYVQDNSSKTSPTRSAVLPDGIKLTSSHSPEDSRKNLHSHTALKHAPECNVMSKQPWFDL